MDSWTVRRDGAGRLVIVNHEGRAPLRDPDPLIRLQATYLAAAAPALHEALERVVRRFELLVARYPDRRDEGLIMEIYGALGDALVPMKEVVRASGNQLEIELDEA